MIIHPSIKYYFTLQFRRFSRRAAEFGLPAFILASIILIVFIIGSAFLFYKTSLANWVYILITIVAIHYLKDHYTNSIFTKKQSLILNILTNNLIAIPFLGFLIYKAEWIPISVLILIPTIMAFIPNRSGLNLKIPTPFRMWPFEFIVGFRQSFLLIILVHFLVFKGIQVGNENLAFASLGFLFLLSMSYYFKPEDEYFAWIFGKTPRQFIMLKIGYALICSSILAIIPAIVLLLCFAKLWFLIPTIFMVGYLYVTTIILGKYSAFPREMSLPQTIILIISLVFPPLLIFSIPAFYKKAIQKLNPILEC